MNGFLFFLILFNVLALVGLLVTIVMIVRQNTQFRKAMMLIEKRIEKCESRLGGHDSQLAALRAELAALQANPTNEITQAIDVWRKRGPLPAILALGGRLFASYFKKQRAAVKAAPAKEKALP
ncbi:MAG: hypothetical protein LCH41_06450 [Armatimonadetes bacterium]|nr:hypothetical protein [Armatimonadota bacterium]